MNLQNIFALVSGILAFIFYVSIFHDALKKVTNPNPTSWCIWALNDTVILFSSFNAGAFNTLSVPLVYSIFGWSILFASMKNKKIKLTILEKICFLGSLVSWCFYFASEEPLNALLIAVIVNTLGGLPTISKLIKDPDSEKFKSWIFILTSGICSLLSLEKYSLELLLFPIASFLMSSTIVALILKRRTR